MTKLIPVDDDPELLEGIRTQVDAADPPGSMVDRNGVAAGPTHPLRLRNPGFALRRGEVIETPSGRLLRVTTTQLLALPDITQSLAVDEPASPADFADLARYREDLRSLAAAASGLAAPAKAEAVNVRKR